MKIFQASNIATGVLPVMLGNVDNDILLLLILILYCQTECNHSNYVQINYILQEWAIIFGIFMKSLLEAAMTTLVNGW